MDDHGYCFVKAAAYRDENVLWLDVSVEYPMTMHVIQRLTQLVHVELHTRLWDITSSVCEKSTRTLLKNLTSQSTHLLLLNG